MILHSLLRRRKMMRQLAMILALFAMQIVIFESVALACGAGEGFQQTEELDLISEKQFTCNIDGKVVTSKVQTEAIYKCIGSPYEAFLIGDNKKKIESIQGLDDNSFVLNIDGSSDLVCNFTGLASLSVCEFDAKSKLRNLIRKNQGDNRVKFEIQNSEIVGINDLGETVMKYETGVLLTNDGLIPGAGASATMIWNPDSKACRTGAINLKMYPDFLD